MNYWQTQQENREFVAAPIDPGWGDYLSASFDNAWHFSAINSMARSYELSQVNDFGKMLEPEEANKRYGIDGYLKFDYPINELEAETIRARKIDEINREYIIGSGSVNARRSTAGFATGLIASVIDPVNLAASFIPVVGEARWARLLQKTGGSLWKARLLKGAIEAGVGNALVEPFVLLPALQEHANYNLTDSAINLGFGTIVGAGMHVGFGAIGDHFKRVDPSVEFKDAENVIKKMRPDEQDEMMSAAVHDILTDAPVSGPMHIAEVTEQATTERARFDAKQARAELMRELGFDVDQPETFKLYPDPKDRYHNSIHDPQPNEPWFHGRGSIELEFEHGRVAWFTRSPEMASDMAEVRLKGNDVSQMTVFVANVDTVKTATSREIQQTVNELQSTGHIVKGIEDGGIAQALNDNVVVDKLKAQGFDSALVYDSFGFVSDTVTLAAFSPDQIHAPGVKKTKTKTGVKFANHAAIEADLNKRVKALKDAKVKNLIEQKRRDFKKKQAELDAAVKSSVVVPDPRALIDPSVANHGEVFKNDIESIKSELMPELDKDYKERIEDIKKTEEQRDVVVSEKQVKSSEASKGMPKDERTEEQIFEDSLGGDERELYNEVILEVNVGGDKTKADYAARRVKDIVMSEVPGMREDRISDFVEYINSADPTPQKKYREWLLKLLKQSPMSFEEDVAKINQRLTEFDAIKKMGTFHGEKDINKYKSFSDLAEAMDKAQGITAANKGGIDVENLPKGATLIGTAGEFSVVKVTDADAMKKLAKDTDWCVTNKDTAEEYLHTGARYDIGSDDPFNLILKGNKPFALVHEASGQFKGVSDRPVLVKGEGVERSSWSVTTHDPVDAISTEDTMNIRYLLEKSGVKLFEQGDEELRVLSNHGIDSKYAEFVSKMNQGQKEPGNIRKIADFLTGKSDTVELNFGKDRAVDIEAQDSMTREKGITGAIDCIIRRLV